MIAATASASALLLGVTGCETTTTAAPPLVICGTTLSNSAEGTVQWTPADAATQLREVRASDGRSAAVILRPNHDRFTITIVGDTGRTTVKVDLPPETPIPTPSLID